MKKIGLIGGTGPEATVDYYKGIIDAFKDESGGLNYPEIIIYSVSLGKLLGFMQSGNFKGAIDYLADAIRRLKDTGADFAAITANTPHIFFDEISERVDLPLISIVEATRTEALRLGLQRPGLFGTGFTMDASFYPDAFRQKGMEVVIPGKEERDWLHHKLFSEIELGIFRDDTREQLINIIEKMVQQQQIDSLILGCTEFPLILTQPAYAGIPVLNTTQIHVEAIVARCRES